MVFKPTPLVNCIRDVRKESIPAPVIGLTPQGEPFNQNLGKELAKFDRLILVCGRYEGFDERIIHEFDFQLSIGDYVLTGGEFAAMTVVDAISRMIPGTVGCQDSVIQDSFYEGILDHPQFTRPASWEGLEVPNVLLNGNHAFINKYRRSMALLTTIVSRPDVFAAASLSDSDKEMIQELISQCSSS